MKKLFTNTLATSLDFLVLIVLSLVATPVLIGHFGVDGYGVFIFLSIFSIYGAMMFFDLGMQDALINYVARFEAADDHRRLQDSLTATVLYYGFLGILLCIGLHFAGGFIADHVIKDGSSVQRESVLAAVDTISVTLFLQFLTIPFTAVLEGMRRYVVTKSLNSFMNVLRYSLIILVAVLFGRFELAFLVMAALAVVRLSILIWIVAFKLPQFRHRRFRIDLTLLRMLFGYSSVLFVTRIAGLIWVQAPKVLIMWYLAVANMTVFDIVSRPAMILRVVIGVIISAIIPEVARLHHAGDIEAIRKLYVNLLRYTYMMLFPVMATLVVNMDWLLQLWVGEEFRQYSYLALLVLTAHMVLPGRVIPATVVVGLEKVRETLWIPTTATSVNLLLGVALLPMVGLLGVILAMLVGEMLSAVPYFFAVRRFLGFRAHDIAAALLRMAALAAAVGAVQLVTRYFAGENVIWLSLASAVSICGGYLISYRCFLSFGERQFIRERLRTYRGRITGSSDEPGSSPADQRLLAGDEQA